MIAEPHEVTADELQAMARSLDLVPIPDRLMPRVLAQVRSHRATLRRFDAADVELADVVTAQPYRA